MRSNAVGRRVTVELDAENGLEEFSGTIVATLRSGKHKVKFDDGDVMALNPSDITIIGESEDDEQIDFTAASVNWDKENINFKVQANGTKFYGWYRKTRIRGTQEICHAIDIYTGTEQHLGVNMIPYDQDPRRDIKSLNADICAAINKWFYSNPMGGKITTITELQQRANQPVIHINRLSSLDLMITRLKEYRDVSMRSGGFRAIQLTSDREGDPTVSIHIDLTCQAIAMKGRVPSLHDGHYADRSVSKSRGENQPEPISHSADDESIMTLYKQLKKCTSKQQAGKLRATLRKMDRNWRQRVKGAQK